MLKNQNLCIVLFLIFQSFCQSQNIELAKAAESIINPSITYDPSYFSIDYPMGDIPADKGVCTDVVIRSFRKLGIDLQQLVHEDMKANFSFYPKLWGLNTTDKNIDHRRVPNLMTYFKYRSMSIEATQNPANYLPGDIVTWDLGSGLTHIGILSSQKTTDGKRYLIVHNIGSGQIAEDILFDYNILGHYRYPAVN